MIGGEAHDGSLELIVGAADSTWATSAKQRRLGIEGFATKVLSSGAGAPSIELKRQPEGFTVPAHMHTTRQFQVLLAGSIDLAGHGRLAAPAAHYTDAWTPYGPFTVGPDMVMLIVRPTRAGLVEMTDPRAAGLASNGRELVVPWDGPGDDTRGTDAADALSAVYVPARRTILVAGEAVEAPATPDGCCLIVEQGTVIAGGRHLGPGSVVFGRDRPVAARAARDGAAVVSVFFDAYKRPAIPRSKHSNERR